jgi:hypothetical protein
MTRATRPIANTVAGLLVIVAGVCFVVWWNSHAKRASARQKLIGTWLCRSGDLLFANVSMKELLQKTVIKEEDPGMEAFAELFRMVTTATLLEIEQDSGFVETFQYMNKTSVCSSGSWQVRGTAGDGVAVAFVRDKSDPKQEESSPLSAERQAEVSFLDKDTFQLAFQDDHGVKRVLTYTRKR